MPSFGLLFSPFLHHIPQPLQHLSRMKEKRNTTWNQMIFVLCEKFKIMSKFTEVFMFNLLLFKWQSMNTQKYPSRPTEKKTNKRNVKHIYKLSVHLVTFSFSFSFSVITLEKITANNLNNWLYVITRTKPFYIQL